jgi:MerR family mercuric resistance operon transcriptional regulator
MSGTIGWLAREGGVGVETVRYYQRRGLLETPERRSSTGASEGVRRYGTDDLKRLRFIRAAQAAGFTLEQIAELLELDAGSDRVRARELATLRIAALDRQIAEMEAARNSLRRLARECARSENAPCPIITAFEPAGSRRRNAV